eukprot:TRINITY_DN1613_c0_g1_i1.p1 TRINITY_DN1613_c0_g1~~TRINITY_DN1613_c0_g1_i1.p1  ORF type:complete len:124 (+),score=2.25 TRINITY_DN1613_c0_g1_i1:322-693(+)
MRIVAEGVENSRTTGTADPAWLQYPARVSVGEACPARSVAREDCSHDQTYGIGSGYLGERSCVTTVGIADRRMLLPTMLNYENDGADHAPVRQEREPDLQLPRLERLLGLVTLVREVLELQDR